MKTETKKKLSAEMAKLDPLTDGAWANYGSKRVKMFGLKALMYKKLTFPSKKIYISKKKNLQVFFSKCHFFVAGLS